MSKKKINDYIFQPGVGKNSNAFPDAYWLLENNLEYIKAEAAGFIAAQITLDTNQNLRPNAVRLLTDNKTFLQDEITAWIAAQVSGNIAPFVGFTYDVAKCKRDVGFVIDAYIYDIRYGGNEKTIEVSKQYWLGGVPQVDGNRAAEVAAHVRLRDIINNNILPRVALVSQQSPVTSTQNTTAPSAETNTTTLITTLAGILTSVIQSGLSVLPAVQFSVYNFAQYIYDSDKCARDVGYVLNAYLHDLRYGGNVKIRQIANRYWDNGVPQVDGDRKPEIVTHQFIRDLINNSVLIKSNPVTSYQNAVNRVGPPTRTAEAGSYLRITALASVLINVIQNGTSSLPAIEYGVSTIKIQGNYKLEDILLITDASTNAIIYNFGDPSLGATAVYDSAFNTNGNFFDSDFPTFLQTSDSITTLYLAADTSTASDTDNIQIFIEEEEQRVRPFDFGTDAIERMRIAAPQSMLDADFEYGLQPTKWQAIGVARGYPSVYEVPGTDTPVQSVVTDASAGTGGVGESLITVTTPSPHGFTAGTPITIKALANTITGFSRAEGTFIVNSVPTSTTFTYYATAKVGTTNGQVLASTYTQLRRGAFYTGANIGTPTITVSSNGTASSFTSKFVTASGTDQIAMTGTMPPTGAPITAAGINPGTQVTATVGPGGSSPATTKGIETNVTAGDTSIVLTDATGVLEGMAVNNGSGTSVFVTGIVGNTVSFTGPITNNRLGNTETYLNRSGTNIQPTGANAVFSVDRVSGQYTNITATTAGTGYIVGNRIVISGTDLGGASPANDLTLTVATINGSGGILTVTSSGTSVSSDATFANLSPTVPNVTVSYTNRSQSSSTGSGLGAVFNIDRSNTGYLATKVSNGDGYAVGEQLIFSGVNFNGTSPTNDISITVTQVTKSYTAVAQNATSGTGVNATFNITRTGNQYDSVTINNGGSGYNIGDTITIFGANLGGLTGTNDLTIQVTNVSGNVITAITSGGVATGLGGINTFNTSGTAYPTTGFGANITVNRTGGLYVVTLNNGGQNYATSNVLTVSGLLLGGASPANDLTLTVATVDGNGAILTYTQSGTSISGNQTFSNRTGILQSAAGSTATFDITRSGGSYTIVTPNSAGTGYFVGDRIRVLGSSLGGATPANDIVINVNSVSNGAIQTASVVSGTAITGVTIEFWSAVSLSEVTTASIPDGTTISASAIAKFLATFSSDHGLVPGSSVIVTISSTGTNHSLAAGPSYVEQVPSSTTFIWTARTTGTVDTVNPIFGIIYARPDTFFVHRPFDGGVQLGTGGPQHGVHAIRMSKKYIRYQSGKGIMYTTGALFAPSFNLSSLTADGTAPGSYITVTTDDVDHGCQVGAEVRIIGVETSGYNSHYIVTDIINERTLRVQAQTTLGNVYAKLGPEAQISLYKWHGATVRAGTFDDQNGMFWQYDGQSLAVGRRYSTFQLAGTITIQPDSNLVTGTGTRFRDQLKAGDKVVIRGMTHTVTGVSSDTSLTVNPDYRGVSAATQAKMCLVQDIIIKQSQFNRDRIDGTGGSGYSVDISKMQMIGIQWSWYGAGFIDFMLRGADGNFVFAHRIRTSNVNTEAYMRSGNLPVRYEVINEGVNGLLASSITANQTSIPLVDASSFPNESGTVYIDNELISFSGKSGNTLIGCSRAVPLTNFAGGSQRTYTAGAAATHEFNTGVILVSCTTSPIISHWGSAMITDGRFDEDRGYIFTYAATGVSVSTTRRTSFLIRLAPSVSNALVGDLGERELLNRAQLLLQSLEVTSDGSVTSGSPAVTTPITGGIVIEGVLNPQNYPTNPSSISWSSLSNQAQGGQPSFAQIAPGGAVDWGASTSTATATVSADIDTGYVYVPFNGSAENVSPIEIAATNYNANGPVLAGAIIFGGDGAGPATDNVYTGGGQGDYFVDRVQQNGSNFDVFFRSTTGQTQRAQNWPTPQLIRFLYRTFTGRVNRLLFTKASWEASGARVGTPVAASDTNWPAGTAVSNVRLLRLGATEFYEVNFNQTSINNIAAGNTVTFEFGVPGYALPGETIFSFIANPGERATVDFTSLKELTNTVLGGRGTYPNGPDVLAINVYKVSGAATTANIILKWGEAQA